VVILSRDAAIASVVNLDSVESVSLGTLVERLGRLKRDRMLEICAALAVQTRRARHRLY
jgi:mRNA-degrading endonuclease toxin of MazEF toxin-antitoxin module